jgi:hypothetical protein
MSKPSKIQKEQSSPPAEAAPDEYRVRVERPSRPVHSRADEGLMNLAYLLMLAAGVVVEENDDER